MIPLQPIQNPILANMAKQAATAAAQTPEQPLPPLISAPQPGAPTPGQHPLPSTIAAPGAHISAPISADVQTQAPERTTLITPPDQQASQAAPLAESNIGRGTLEGDTNEVKRLLNTGSGVSQLHGKIENSSFGQAHPLLGKVLGWGAQIPLQIADTAASAIAPGITSQLPGTEYHHDVLVNNANRQLGQDVINQEHQAQTDQAEAQAAEIPLANARAETQQKAELQEHGLESNNGDLTPIAEENLTPQQKQAIATQRSQAAHLGQQTPEEAAFNSLLKRGVSPSDAFGQLQQMKNIKDPTMQQQYLDALSSGDTKKINAINATIKATNTQPKIDIHTATAAASGAKTRDANTEKEYMATKKGLDSSFQTAKDQISSLNEARELISSGAMGQAFGQVKSLVGLAGGKGSGVRITQAELNSIASARGVEGNFNGWVNQMEGKGKLSDTQRKQLDGILSDAQDRMQQKQQLYSDTLDKLGDAGSTQEIRQIEKDYRHASMDQPEGGGAKRPQGATGQAMGNDKKLHWVKKTASGIEDLGEV